MYIQATNDELSLNKLIILYMLDTIDIPLSNSTITEFILEEGYTNSFSLQEYLNQMQDANLIYPKVESGKTLFIITKEGKATFELFKDRLPLSIQEMAKQYLLDHKYDIRTSAEIIAEYIPEKDDEYIVHCVAKEKNRILFEVNIRVYDKETAIEMINSFKENNHKVYKTLLMALSE